MKRQSISDKPITQQELAEAEEERRKIQRNFRAIALLAVLVLASGAIFYHLVEHLNWVDAIYFCTITLATVGYGDIVPKTDAGKLFTSFYVLVGIGIIATFANQLLKNSYSRRQLRSKKRSIDDDGSVHGGVDLE